MSARRTRLHPGFEFEYERPEPPTGRLAMRLLGHVESQPGVTIRQLGSEHGLTQDIASSLVREFVVSGVMYVTGDGAPLSRTVYCVPRDWPTRPSVGVTDGDRERLMVAGYGER